MNESGFARASPSLLLAALLASGAGAAELPVAAQVEVAARVQLLRQADAAQLVEPQFTLTVASARPVAACAQPVAVEALDTRSVARMRFAVRCPDQPGWRADFVVRAALSAKVAVTSAPVAAGQPISAEQLALERRDIAAIDDSIGTLQAVAGQTSRRALRAGEVLRRSQLAAPLLVRRGEPVQMVARREQVEVSSAGEALENGALDAVIRVRNANSGQVLRVRVTGPATVEPLATGGLTR